MSSPTFLVGVYCQIWPSPASPPSLEPKTTESSRIVQPSPPRNFAAPLARPCLNTADALSSALLGSGSSIVTQSLTSTSPTVWPVMVLYFGLPLHASICSTPLAEVAGSSGTNR